MFSLPYHVSINNIHCLSHTPSGCYSVWARKIATFFWVEICFRQLWKHKFELILFFFFTDSSDNLERKYFWLSYQKDWLFILCDIILGQFLSPFLITFFCIVLLLFFFQSKKNNIFSAYFSIFFFFSSHSGFASKADPPDKKKIRLAKWKQKKIKQKKTETLSGSYKEGAGTCQRNT